MNIAIDTTPMQSGHKARGVGRYTRFLIEALQKSKNNHVFYFFTRGEKLPRNVDLVHYPYFDPFFLTLPIIQSVPYIVTVHDLIPLIYPDKFPRGFRGEIVWQVQRRSLGKAQRVITDSESSKKDITGVIGMPQDKIDVVYLAPSSIFERVNDKKRLQSVKERYDLPEKFILYVGDVNWNKNILGLLESFAKVLASDHHARLVLVGQAFLDEQLPEVININQKINALHIDQFVKKLGFVPDSDLAALYTLATVYIQLSFVEGFGFSVLEAMACGCPVVTSHASSLAEIAGPAIKINPIDSIDIVHGINMVLRTENRHNLSKKAIAWAKRYTWEKVAHQTIAVYEKARSKNI